MTSVLTGTGWLATTDRAEVDPEEELQFAPGLVVRGAAASIAEVIAG